MALLVLPKLGFLFQQKPVLPKEEAPIREETPMRVEKPIFEYQSPFDISKITPQFVSEKAQAITPQFVSGETPFFKRQAEAEAKTREAFAEPLLKSLPFGIGERLSATPEQQEAIKENYKTYTFADAGKDIVNMGLNFTINPLARLGLTGQELFTGERVGVGPGIGFEGAKTFPKDTIGSYQSIFEADRKAGGSVAGAGLRVGVLFAFDLLMGVGMAKSGIPLVRYSARQLPETLLFRIKNEKIPIDGIIGSLTGAEPTPRADTFISSLTNEERISLFRLARAYEDAGGTFVPITEKVPTALGKFAKVEEANIPTEIRPTRQLPGFVGEPQPAFGLSIRPVKRVGGVPEVPKVSIPKELEPLAIATKQFAEGTKVWGGGVNEWLKSLEGLSHDEIEKISQQLIRAGFIEKPPAGMISKRIVPDFKDFYTQATKGIEEIKPALPRAEVSKLDELKWNLKVLEKTIIDHPARPLIKYANKNQELPEVLGMVGGKFMRFGDDIASEFGFGTSEEARASYQQLIRLRKERDLLKERISEIQKSAILELPKREITQKDLDKIFSVVPETEEAIIPPTKPPKPPTLPTTELPPEEPIKPIISKRKKVLAKDYLQKIKQDFESLGGFENGVILQDMNEIGGYHFSNINELQEVIVMTEKITRPKMTLEEKEINKLIMRTEKEQKTLLSIAQREAIQKLHDIAKPSEATKFYATEENQSWIRAIKQLQSEKELSGITVSRIKKALQIDNIKRADQPKLQELYDFMSKLEKGDAFLTPKQVSALSDILKEIERPDLVPKRIVIDQFGEKEEVLGKGITGRILNELVPTIDIKEGHPLVSKIVNKADELLRQAEKEVEKQNRNVDKMMDKAVISRVKLLPFGEKLKREVIPQDKEIFQAMSGQKIELTREEVAVVAYLKNFFKKVREDLKLEKYRQHYITHLEQPLTEKILNEGFIKAVVDIFKLKPKENIPLNIMLELDNIIGSEKFFRFALERKGGISPTTNIRKIVNDYSRLYETKKALDQILPEGQAVVQLLLQPKTAVWTKRFLQNLKGRGLDTNFRTGKMGWLAKMADGIIDVGYIKLLGLNYWSALKNLVAGEANSFIYQDFRTYLAGKKRFATSPVKSVKMALEYGILEGTFADYTQRGIGKLKKLQDLAMIGQRGGEYEIRTSIFVAELTPEEFASGKITPERVREIKDVIGITQGIFSKTDSPLWIQTWYGRLLLQMNRWRITNAMLLRRLIRDVIEEQRRGQRYGKGARRLSKAFIIYGIGMYLAYELGKAGYKKAAKVAQSMAETVNSIIALLTTDVIYRTIADNPTYSVLKELTFTIQNLANYIGVPGVEEPRELEFARGIEETWIAPIERTRELLGIEETKSASSKASLLGLPPLPSLGFLKLPKLPVGILPKL